jgi:uncharacterized protein DUF2800
MRFNNHSKLAGNHALLSPSTYSWVNDDDQKMDARIYSALSARRGTELHEVAQRLINLGIKLPDTTQTMNQYVNDCIGFRMTTEQSLYYSPNCFGTADAINFKALKLKIFDLKTGITRTKVTQLEVYAALFCLEYGYVAVEIEMEFRIYQNDQVFIFDGDPIEVARIMSQIVAYDRRIEELRMEAYG